MFSNYILHFFIAGPLIDASKKYLLELLKELKSYSSEKKEPTELSTDECSGKHQFY